MMFNHCMIRSSLCVALLAFAGAGCRAASLLAPPQQPASGPGGADYAHDLVISKRSGEGSGEYWVFHPEGPRPADAPVVVFLHGWGGMDPSVYGAWFRHVVRKGHIVIYPRYQSSLGTPADEMTPAALEAVRAAWADLSANGPVRPRPDGLAWVGHSLGGVMAANLAASYAEHGLPAPTVLMAVHPGGEGRLPVGNLAGLPTDTLVLLIVGDDDRTVADRGAKAILDALSHMPPGNVELVTVQSDVRANPALIANHLAPLASVPGFPPAGAAAEETESVDEPRGGPFRRRLAQRQAERYGPDALDYYGFWKLLDGLLDAAFRGVHREYALGNTPQQRFMGRLSDGEPVAPLVVGRR